MNATRDKRISVNLTADVLAKLEEFAQANRWTVSTAAVVLIERGLAGDAK